MYERLRRRRIEFLPLCVVPVLKLAPLKARTENRASKHEREHDDQNDDQHDHDDQRRVQSACREILIGLSRFLRHLGQIVIAQLADRLIDLSVIDLRGFSAS